MGWSGCGAVGGRWQAHRGRREWDVASSRGGNDKCVGVVRKRQAVLLQIFRCTVTWKESFCQQNFAASLLVAFIFKLFFFFLAAKWGEWILLHWRGKSRQQTRRRVFTFTLSHRGDNCKLARHQENNLSSSLSLKRQKLRHTSRAFSFLTVFVCVFFFRRPSASLYQLMKAQNEAKTCRLPPAGRQQYKSLAFPQWY